MSNETSICHFSSGAYILTSHSERTPQARHSAFSNVPFPLEGVLLQQIKNEDCGFLDRCWRQAGVKDRLS